METILKAFFKLDDDYSEKLYVQELTDEVQMEELVTEGISGWKTITEMDPDSHVTLKTLCNVLGTTISYARFLREHLPYMKFVEVISGDLPLDKQMRVARILRDLLRSERIDEAVVCTKLKEMLDQQWGQQWQVAISNQSLWCNYSYEPNTSFCFRMRGRIFLIWQRKTT